MAAFLVLRGAFFPRSGVSSLLGIAVLSEGVLGVPCVLSVSDWGATGGVRIRVDLRGGDTAQRNPGSYL